VKFHPKSAGGSKTRRHLKTGTLFLGIIGLIACLAGCWTNGVHVVGNGSGQLKPGLYTSARPLVGTSQACLFRLFSSGKPLGNDVEFGGRSFIQILPTDTGVFSDGCGIWDTPKATSYNPDRATAKIGAYRIPTDLLPGTYTAPGGPDCSWTRVKDFTGDLTAIIATSSDPTKPFKPAVHPRVTIASADAGFLSDICGGWTRVGP
jgi:hypothetical protein